MLKTIRKAAALTCAALILVCGGCGWPKSVELSKRLIVEAIGLDGENGRYTVTLQALDTDAAGKTDAQEADAGKTRVWSFTGETVGAALAQIPNATGHVPLYSQARLLLLGGDLAQGDVIAPLDYFLREYHARSDILLAAAENSAAEVLRADLGSGAPGADVLEEALLRGSENGFCCTVKLYRFMDLLYSETDDAYCPVITLRDANDGGRVLPDARGTAFFKNGRLAYTTPPEITRGLLFLTDKIKNTALTVRGETCVYTFKTVRAGTKYRLRRNADGVRCTIEIAAVCDIVEFAGQNGEQLDERHISDARAAGTKRLRALAENAFSYFYGQRQTDACRLLRRVDLRFPKYTKAFRETLFTQKAGHTEITVLLTVRRTGKENL